MTEAPLIEADDVPAEARLPTKFGEFKIRVFHEAKTGLDHGFTQNV